MKIKRIGLRSLKTIISVTLCFIIAGIFPQLSPGMLAAAATTAINISIFDSFRSSFDRIMANVTAILLAFLLQIMGQVNPIGVAIGMLILVIVCNIFSWQYIIGSATIFFVFVLEVPYFTDRNFTNYAINRMFDTFIGTLVGLLVNTYVLRPRQEKYLLQSYKRAYLKIRSSFKDLMEVDKSVEEIALIDLLTKINENYRHLRNDVKLKMNENINTITISKLNNLFRIAVSLIIELNDMEEIPKLTEYNKELLLRFYKGDFEREYATKLPVDSEYYSRYNYEVRKTIHTLESIEYNIREFSKMYEKLGKKWYLEGKDM